VGLYASTSCLVYRARGFRDGAPRVQGADGHIAPLKDTGDLQYIFLSPGLGPARVLPGPCGPARFLAGPFWIQVAVALSHAPWSPRCHVRLMGSKQRELRAAWDMGFCLSAHQQGAGARPVSSGGHEVGGWLGNSLARTSRYFYTLVQLRSRAVVRLKNGLPKKSMRLAFVPG
jgi:hypothetical protein